MRKIMLMLVLAASGAATAVEAQTTSISAPEGVRFMGAAGLASLWDDETFLGRGPVVSGGIVQPLGSRAWVEGELSWTTHYRDAGYLAADGSALAGTARLAYAFRSASAHTRPFASAGMAFVHSTGHFTTRSLVPGAGGLLPQGPALRSDWSLTRPALEFGGGVRIKSGQRLSFRPEVRWTSTAAASSPRPTLEEPIWVLRAGLGIE